RPRGLHQLPRLDDPRHAAVLRHFRRALRRAVAGAGLADRAAGLGIHAAVVQMVARPLSLRPLRMGLAQPVALEMGTPAPNRADGGLAEDPPLKGEDHELTRFEQPRPNRRPATPPLRSRAGSTPTRWSRHIRSRPRRTATPPCSQGSPV